MTLLELSHDSSFVDVDANADARCIIIALCERFSCELRLLLLSRLAVKLLGVITVFYWYLPS